MDEFEAGSKRIKRTETTEKTVYNSKEFTEKERDKLKVAPIGGKIKKTKKRDIKDGIKSKNYKYKNETEDKEELTEQIKELKRFYNQLRVKTGELKPNIEQRTELVNNCLQIIGNDFKKYAFKHDSWRVLQCMLKRGSADQKKLIIDKLTELFVELCTNKYSHYLAKKIVKYWTDEDQRKKLVSAVLNKMEKLVNHMFASDIIEELYSKILNNC